MASIVVVILFIWIDSESVKIIDYWLNAFIPSCIKAFSLMFTILEEYHVYSKQLILHWL